MTITTTYQDRSQTTVITCDTDGCTTEILAAGINVWLDGWTKRGGLDYCPEHAP